MAVNGRSERALADHHPPDQEQELSIRNNKKVRKGGEGFSGTLLSMPRVEEWMQEEPDNTHVSYANIVQGNNKEEPNEDSESKEEDSMSEDEMISESKNKGRNNQQKNSEKSDIVIGYAVMKRILEAIWRTFGGIDVIDLGNDFYLVRFFAEDDLDHALLDGPWKIYDHYLVVYLWEPNFNPLTTSIDKSMDKTIGITY
ncbi:uncharacterized protein DS421_3g90760 [Arachis hypogaea]|nr:uncharacterized protein DS421_3g90760 [Arachis hypogaea]